MRIYLREYFEDLMTPATLGLIGHVVDEGQLLDLATSPLISACGRKPA